VFVTYLQHDHMIYADVIVALLAVVVVLLLLKKHEILPQTDIYTYIPHTGCFHNQIQINLDQSGFD